MTNVDVIARLRLNGEEFASQVASQFANMQTRAASAASEIRSSFTGALADVQRMTQSALTLPRTSGGSLDLSGEIAELRASQAAAEQRAIASREMAAAMLAAATAGTADAEALRLDADAAKVSALAAENNAQAIRDRITALTAVQAELGKGVSATRLDAAANDEVAHASNRASVAKMEMMHVVRSSSDAFAAGAPLTQIFAMEIGRVGEAAALSGGGSGALGRLGAFLGSGWGLAITVGIAVLAPFVAKLFEQNDALTAGVDKLRKNAAETEASRAATEAYNKTIEGEIALQKKLNDELDRSILTQRQVQQNKLYAAQQTVADQQNNKRPALLADIAAQEQVVATRRRILEQPGGRGGTNDPYGLNQPSFDTAQKKLIDLRNELTKLDNGIAAGLAGIREAQIPLIQNDVAAQFDKNAEAVRKYDIALGNLNQQFKIGAGNKKNMPVMQDDGTFITQLVAGISRQEYERQLAIITAAKKAAEKAAKDAERDAKAGPLTSFMMPVNGTVTSPFGAKRNYETHPGVDIAVPVGTPVRAPSAGTVDAAGLAGKLGNTIVINFGGGTTGRFGHLSKFNVKPGDTVEAGDIIGYSGGARGAEGAGNSTGPHLHYEIKSGGRLVDPLKGQFRTDPSAANDDAQKRAEAAARAAKEFADQQQHARDTILQISTQWDEQPKLIDRARIEANKLTEIITLYSGKTDDASKAIVANARAAQQLIAEGINRPFDDYVKAQKESLAIQTLSLQGRDVEAAAMQDILRLQQAQGQVSDEQIATAFKYEAAQKRIRDLLEDQRRIVQIATGAVGELQQGFDQFLSSVRTDAGKSLKGLFSSFFDTFQHLQDKLLSNAIFGGVDRAVEEYTRKITGQKTPAEILTDQATSSGVAMQGAYDDAGGAVKDFASTVRSAMRSITGSDGTAVPLVGKTQGGRTLADAVADAVRPAANDNWDPNNVPDLVMTTARIQKEQVLNDEMGKAVNATNIFGIALEKSAENLLHMFGIEMPATMKKFFEGDLGKLLGGALAGQMGGSVFASITGGKNDKTASGIGGAIGGWLTGDKGPLNKVLSSGLESIAKGLGSAAGPIGAVLGGVLGNVLGGLFSKPKWSNATITTDSTGHVAAGGNAAGRGSDAVAAANNEVSSVASAVNSILDQFNASVKQLSPITMGTFNGNYRVDVQGRSGSMDSKNMPGVKDFGGDQQAAVTYAVAYELSHSVIDGISKASQTILQKEADVNSALQKVTLIESIPHDLKAMLDPMGGAIDDLNTKWKHTVDALTEGGASAEQWAQAQQLYKLQLDQVKASTASATQTLKDFRDSLNFGQNSPYALRDQEASARTALQPFLDTIAAGGTIDQSKYQSAAQTFLDIERQLYGSTQDYFDALDSIQAATTKAISTVDNATPITPGVPDPFAKATADATNQVASNTQTGNELLSQVSDQLADLTQIMSQMASQDSSFSDYITDGRLYTKVAAG